MRIVSLLPAATEIVGVLGQLDSLVGVSHECDFPSEVNDKPRVTFCPIHGAELPSAEVDRWVSETLASTGTLYRMDEALLGRLKPDVILTQRLCEVAGGIDPLGLKGCDSSRIPWERVLEAQPEIIVLACCGYTVQRTLHDLPILRAFPGYAELPAARHGRVCVVDGSAYFSRPGPRIVDSLEILAEIIHPEVFRASFPVRGAIFLDSAPPCRKP